MEVGGIAASKVPFDISQKVDAPSHASKPRELDAFIVQKDPMGAAWGVWVVRRGRGGGDWTPDVSDDLGKALYMGTLRFEAPEVGFL